MHSAIESALLYTLPVAARVALTTRAPRAEDVLLSLLPLLIGPLAGLLLPRVAYDVEHEHVLRHASYAVGFSLALGVGVHWDVVAEHLDDDAPWAVALVFYASAGAAALWGFAIVHVLENAGAPLQTHRGDVAVLPLTLVAIATFAEDVPDEAFRFLRTTIFYVPVVVGWATLQFVAYRGFARGTTTSYHDAPGFGYHALGGLAVASAHLWLLETRSPPPFFQLLAIAAALLCQATPHLEHAPCVRSGVRLATALAAAAAAGGGAALALRRADVAFVAAGAGGVAAVCAPPLTGALWPLPSALLAALLSLALAHAHGVAITALGSAACAGGYYLAFRVAAAVADPVRAAVDQRAPATPVHCEPWMEERAGPSWTRADVRARLPQQHRTDDGCPAALRGVWWLRTFALDAQGAPRKAMPWIARGMMLLCVEDAKWTADGRATLCLARHVSTHSRLTRLGLWGTWAEVAVDPRDARWVRTDVWVGTRALRGCPETYWLFLDDDRAVRAGMATDGRVRWMYPLTRVLRNNDAPTRYLGPMLAA